MLEAKYNIQVDKIKEVDSCAVFNANKKVAEESIKKTEHHLEIVSQHISETLINQADGFQTETVAEVSRISTIADSMIRSQQVHESALTVTNRALHVAAEATSTDYRAGILLGLFAAALYYFGKSQGTTMNFFMKEDL
jgi:replicative superfamily II helicase